MYKHWKAKQKQNPFPKKKKKKIPCQSRQVRSYDKVQLWSLDLVQAPNLCQGLGPGSGRGVWVSPRVDAVQKLRNGKNTGNNEARLRSTQMTTLLHAGQGPF